jgi:hypothetical protein
LEIWDVTVVSSEALGIVRGLKYVRQQADPSGRGDFVIQRAGGWRTPIMMQRYAHLDPRTIKAAVALLDANGHHDASEPAEGRSKVATLR